MHHKISLFYEVYGNLKFHIRPKNQKNFIFLRKILFIYDDMYILETFDWELSENHSITLAWERVSIRFQNYNNTSKLKIEIFQSIKSATDCVAFQITKLHKIYSLFLKLLKFFRKGLVYRYEISSCRSL